MVKKHEDAVMPDEDFATPFGPFKKKKCGNGCLCGKKNKDHGHTPGVKVSNVPEPEKDFQKKIAEVGSATTTKELEKVKAVKETVKNNDIKNRSDSFSNMKFTYLSTFSNAATASSYFPDFGRYDVFFKSMFAGFFYYQANKLTETHLWKTKGKKETKDVELNGMTTTTMMIAQWCLLINSFPELSNIRYSYQCAALVGMGPLVHWIINDWVSHKVRNDRSSSGVNIFDVTAANLLMTKLLNMSHVLGVKTKDIGIAYTIMASFLAKGLVDQAGNALVKLDRKVIDPAFSGIMERTFSGLNQSCKDSFNNLWNSDKTKLREILDKSSKTYGKVLDALKKIGKNTRQDSVWLSESIYKVFSKETKEKHKNKPINSRDIKGRKKSTDGSPLTTRCHSGTCGCANKNNGPRK